MEEIKKMLIQLMEGQESIKIDIGSMKNDIKKIDFKIEELDKKTDFSLEGHKTNTEQLNRIVRTRKQIPDVIHFLERLRAGLWTNCEEKWLYLHKNANKLDIWAT